MTPRATLRLPVAQKPLTVTIRDGGRVASGGKERVSDLPAIINRLESLRCHWICRCQRRSGKNCVEHAGFPKFIATWTPGTTATGRVGHLNLYRWRVGC